MGAVISRVYDSLSSRKILYIAQYDYNPRYPFDLQFKAGDALLIYEAVGNWYSGKNLRTNKDGFIPDTYAIAENRLDSNIWFFPDIQRMGAEKLLELESAGTFLVRKCTKHTTQFALSIRTEDSPKNEKCIHYKINCSNGKLFYISHNLPFRSLQELVQAYTDDTNGKYGLAEKITTPCPKPPPVLYELSGKYRTDWSIPASEIVIKEKLGSGCFGDVFMGNWYDINVAIKCIKLFNIEDFQKEIEPLKMLKHINVIAMYGICVDEDPKLIIFEYMPNGCLENFLKCNDLHEDELNYIAAQIAAGMEYIGSKNIVHRDLAARNVLLGDKLTAKIADFGLSRFLDENYCYETPLPRIPFRWLAPECFNNTFFTTKSDVWAFGVVVIELYTNATTPYADFKSSREVYKYILDGNRIEKPERISSEIYRIILQCWQQEPEVRPTFKMLVEVFMNLYA